MSISRDNNKEKIIIIGAGGHAKVCAEILLSMGKSIAYCIGNNTSADFCLNIPVLKGDENLELLYAQGYSKAFVAIGSNQLRKKLADQVVRIGYELVSAISPHAIISPSAKMGNGLAIMSGVIINAESEIKDLAIINTGATIDHDCVIGQAAHIAPQCGLAGNVKVGNYSFLGVGSKVIPEIHIGEDVTIGAGSVVINHILNSKVAVGVPARIIK